MGCYPSFVHLGSLKTFRRGFVVDVGFTLLICGDDLIMSKVFQRSVEFYFS